MATIQNDWITITNKYKGVTIQRKFLGLDTEIHIDTNEVIKCNVYYAQREFYPNDIDIIKTEKKYYTLIDLPYTETQEQDGIYYQEALAVLTGFIVNLGQPGIVDPARETLENDVILPFNAYNGYELRKDTREKILKSND